MSASSTLGSAQVQEFPGLLPKPSVDVTPTLCLHRACAEFCRTIGTLGALSATCQTPLTDREPLRNNEGDDDLLRACCVPALPEDWTQVNLPLLSRAPELGTNYHFTVEGAGR